MPHSGSFFRTSSKVFCEARCQKECWNSMPLSKTFCASALHEVTKCTVPSLPSSFARAGTASINPVVAKDETAIDLTFIVNLQWRSHRLQRLLFLAAPQVF